MDTEGLLKLLNDPFENQEKDPAKSIIPSKSMSQNFSPTGSLIHEKEFKTKIPELILNVFR